MHRDSGRWSIGLPPTVYQLNGLQTLSRLIVDKVTTMPREKSDKKIGRISDTDMTRLNRAIMVFLGLAG